MITSFQNLQPSRFRKPLSLVVIFMVLFSTWVKAEEYKIDKDRSFIRVLTDKSGFLGGLAHYHVITINKLSGVIEVNDNNSGTSELVLKPEDFALDDPADTGLYPDKFDGPVKEKAIRATRKNMLGKKLFDVAQFPEIAVNVHVEDASSSDVVFGIQLDVKGAVVALQIPGKMLIENGQLQATSRFESSNPALGLPVFKAFGRSISVGKKLDIEVNVVADDIAQPSKK